MRILAECCAMSYNYLPLIRFPNEAFPYVDDLVLA